jgi:hypothetical protein
MLNNMVSHIDHVVMNHQNHTRTMAYEAMLATQASQGDAHARRRGQPAPALRPHTRPLAPGAVAAASRWRCGRTSLRGRAGLRAARTRLH